MAQQGKPVGSRTVARADIDGAEDLDAAKADKVSSAIYEDSAEVYDEIIFFVDEDDWTGGSGAFTLTGLPVVHFADVNKYAVGAAVTLSNAAGATDQIGGLSRPLGLGGGSSFSFFVTGSTGDWTSVVIRMRTSEQVRR
jgi:hypothetical protein